jgi:hypothetical protein
MFFLNMVNIAPGPIIFTFLVKLSLLTDKNFGVKKVNGLELLKLFTG